MSDLGWLVKVNRPDGRIVGFHDTKADAEAYAADMNQQFQTDEYYVEEYDSAKEGLTR